jgi:hypothetical protein
VTVDLYGSPKFWLLWLAILLICVQQGIKAVRTPTGMLGFVPVICVMFGYLFVIQAMAVATTLGNLISVDFLELGEFIALLSLIAILAGWYRGSGRAVLAPHEPVDPARGEMLWYCAISALCVGIVGEYVTFIYFFRDLASTTAYLILLFHLGYPGLAICVYLASYSQEFRSASNVLVLVILGSAFLLPWVYYVRRGPTFTFLVVLVYAFYLARPRRINRAVILSGLTFACGIMLFYVTIRDYSSEAASWSGQRFQNLSASNILLQKAYTEGDNEFLYNCCYIGTCYELDRFQWGTSFLSLSVQWIPRQWWPDKPAMATGWFDPIAFDDIFEMTGVMPSPGCAMTGIAETFMEFGWLTPVFWYGLGWLFGRAYRLALRRPLTFWPIVYVGLIASTHYLFTQGFSPFFVPSAFYVFLPIVVYTLVGNLAAKSLSKRRTASVLSSTRAMSGA